MNIIEQIKGEIERLEKEIYYDKVKFGEQKVNRGPSSIESAALGILNHFKSYLLSLEEKSEKPMDQDGLEEEIKRYYDDWDGNCRYAQTARHFAQWGAEHLKQ